MSQARLRSQSRGWSWSRSKPSVLAGVGVGAGVDKIENIERQEGKESGSMNIRLKRYLVTVFRLPKVYEIILWPLRSLCDFVNKFRLPY